MLSAFRAILNDMTLCMQALPVWTIQHTLNANKHQEIQLQVMMAQTLKESLIILFSLMKQLKLIMIPPAFTANSQL